MEQKWKALYRYTEIEGMEHPAHVFGIDYFEPGSNGEHLFSRKEVLFYHDGDEDLKKEFSAKLEDLLRELFVLNSVDWDFVTLAPSRQRDGLNENMLEIVEKASSRAGMEYSQVMRRTRELELTSELSGSQGQISNQEGSIEVSGEVEGKNVVIVENVSVTGIELVYMTQVLLEAGAERVYCLTLGLTNDIREVRQLEKGVTASHAVEERGSR